MPPSRDAIVSARMLRANIVLFYIFLLVSIYKNINCKKKKRVLKFIMKYNYEVTRKRFVKIFSNVHCAGETHIRIYNIVQYKSIDYIFYLFR